MATPNKLMQGDSAAFANETRKLINNKDLSDIRFVIGTSRKTIYGHKCILSARCDVFKAMFAEQAAQGKDSGNEVPFMLSDMSPDVFLILMEYLYTNAVSLTSKNCVDVLACATEYGLEGLKRLCIQFMLETLCVEAACDYLQAAVTFKQEKLKDVAMDYIARNTAPIFKTKAFNELSDTALSLILKSNDLQIDELDLLAGVREWANINSVVLGKSVQHVAKKVIGHVRLPLLSPDELEKVDEGNKKDKLIPVDQLAIAWKCHALGKAESDMSARRNGTRPRDCHQGMSSLDVLNKTKSQFVQSFRQSASTNETCMGIVHASRATENHLYQPPVRRSPSATEKSTWAMYNSANLENHMGGMQPHRSPSVTEKSTRSTYFPKATDIYYTPQAPRRSPSATDKYAGTLYSTRTIDSIIAQQQTPRRSPSALLL